MTALKITVCEDHVAVVKLLLSHPNIKVNHYLRPPLWDAISRNKSLEMIGILLSHKDTDVNEYFEDISVIKHICLVDEIAIIELFLSPKHRHKFDINQTDRDGNTISHHTCKSGAMLVLMSLLRHDIFQPYAYNNFKRTPLELACSSGQHCLVRMLVVAGLYSDMDSYLKARWPRKTAMYNQTDKIYISMVGKGLWDACKEGHVTVTQFLFNSLPYGPEALISYLKRAIQHNRVKVVTVIIKSFYRHVGETQTIHELLLQHLWNPHKEITRELFRLWLFMLRHDDTNKKTEQLETHSCDSGEYLNSDAHEIKQITQLYMSAMPKTEITHAIELQIIQHSVEYGLDEVAGLFINNSANIALTDISKVHESNGISTLNLCAKRQRLIQIIKAKYGTESIENNIEFHEFCKWYALKWFIDSSVSSDTIKLLKWCDPTPEQIPRFTASVVQGNKQHIMEVFKKIKTIAYMDKKSSKKRVTNVINSLLQSVRDAVSEDDSLFRFAPKRVGSSREGTRPYIPYEFDFLLWFEEIQKYIESMTHYTIP